MPAATPRIIHSMLKVKDLDASVRFYTECLGMKLLRTSRYDHGKFTIAILGYEAEADGAVLELRHDREEGGGSAGYDHMAIAVHDASILCGSRAESAGGKVVQPAGPLAHNGVVVGCIEDPDGNRIEVVQADKRWHDRIALSD